MRRFSKSKYFVVGIAAAAILTIGMGSTFALLKVQAREVKNIFHSAKINVQVIEVLPGGSKTQGSDGNPVVNFGSVQKDVLIDKNVCIENLHSEAYPTTDTFVRCRVVPILRDGEGNSIAERITFETVGMDSGWKISETDGESYYYWTRLLARGEKTKPLFEHMKVTSDIPQGAYLELQILVDAVQARPYPSAGFGRLPEEQREKEGKRIPSYAAWKWYYDGNILTN